jgi:alpha-beta hydrolase superfamily lysophospholipase
MKKPTLKRWRFPLACVLVGYALLAGGMALNQRAFIYVPFTGPTDPVEAGLPHFSRHHITTAEGTPILYWESVHQHNAPSLFYFHGNGGGLHQFTHTLQFLEDQGYHVVAMEYRGYPDAPKGPSETALVADGIALVDAIRTQYPHDKAIIWGYSLGSGVATQVAASRAPDVLILEAPFTAVVDRAAEMFPFLPAKWLMRDTYLSRVAIRTIHAPVFIMHGDEDLIIPPHHGQELFALANEPKSLGIYKGYAHLNLISSPAYSDAVTFIRDHLK